MPPTPPYHQKKHLINYYIEIFALQEVKKNFTNKMLLIIIVVLYNTAINNVPLLEARNRFTDCCIYVCVLLFVCLFTSLFVVFICFFFFVFSFVCLFVLFTQRKLFIVNESV